jgi:hypothetical protein
VPTETAGSVGRNAAVHKCSERRHRPTSTNSMEGR